MPGNQNKTFLYNGATYHDSKPLGLSRLFYIDLWYAQFIDNKAGIEFFVNICLNNPFNVKLADKIGLKRSCDTIVCTWANGEHRVNPLHYYYEFSAQSKMQDLDLGHGALVMKTTAVPSDNDPTCLAPIIHLRGSEPSIKVEYDLTYKRLVMPCRPTIHDFGTRVRNILWDYPFMPLANVIGKFSIDGRNIDIDTNFGYSDSMWGSTMVWYYNPWVIIQADGIVVLAWASGATRKRNMASVFVAGGWHDVKNPSFITIETTTSDKFNFTYPNRQRIVGKDDNLELDIEVLEKHEGFIFNVGTEKLIVPAMRSLSYTANGTVKLNGVTYEIKNAPTSFDIWNKVDFLKMVSA